MTIRTIQTCARCGTERELKATGRQLESPETGGWRVLNHGAKNATHCSDCIRELVDTALEATRRRANPAEAAVPS